MNIFFVESNRVTGDIFELKGQEAQHAAKVLRLRNGDEIHATDGEGKRYTGIVTSINKDSVTASIKEKKEVPESKPHLILAMGIIKKRDRLEFALEKAVELGASEIVLFNSDHTEKTNVRVDRLETIAMSAMKQSLRSWLPKVLLHKSLEDVLKSYPEFEVLMAHEKISEDLNSESSKTLKDNMLLLVGPEGGFSDREVELVKQNGGELVSLGEYRLRAETAAVAFLSRFI
ncbi:MAG: RsmE family RNA methyltransferase [Balneolaceae bacterium]